MSLFTVSVSSYEDKGYIVVIKEGKVIYEKDLLTINKDILTNSLNLLQGAFKFLQSVVKFKDVVKVEVKTERLRGMLSEKKGVGIWKNSEKVYYTVLRIMETLPVDFIFFKTSNLKADKYYGGASQGTNALKVNQENLISAKNMLDFFEN